MTKAEERALEAYPQNEVIVYGPLPGANEPNRIDDNLKYRIGYAEGYEQAEKDLTFIAQFSSGPDGFFYGRGYQQAKKDLALTWEDMRRISRILDIMVDDDFKGEIPEEWGEEKYYEEVLRRFNKAKEEKK